MSHYVVQRTPGKSGKAPYMGMRINVAGILTDMFVDNPQEANMYPEIVAKQLAHEGYTAIKVLPERGEHLGVRLSDGDGGYIFSPPTDKRRHEFIERLQEANTKASIKALIGTFITRHGVHNADKLETLDWEDAANNRTPELGNLVRVGLAKLINTKE